MRLAPRMVLVFAPEKERIITLRVWTVRILVPEQLAKAAKLLSVDGRSLPVIHAGQSVTLLELSTM